MWTGKLICSIVAILIDAGLRRSEIVGLRLCDVDRELPLQADRGHLSDLVPVPKRV
jgi:integrase